MMRKAKTNETNVQREAGFTLVELLVALSLLSLVSVALFASLRFGILAWSRSTAHSDRVEHIVFTQNLLRRLISDAYPFFLTDGQGRGTITFDGTSASLRFLASSPVALGGAGRSWFTLSLDRHGERLDFILTSKPELADRNDSSKQIRRVLIAGVRSAECAYFGNDRSDKVGTWSDRWASQASLPDLVRIRIDFPTDDARTWPEFVARPRIMADVGCIYDSLSKRCRGR